MSLLTIVLLVAVFAAMMLFSGRARRRQAAAEQSRREQIRVGTRVMTTSGLYGTVVGIDDSDDTDPTVKLSIAPGVEVTWALAALRDMDSLPDRYRSGPSLEKRPDPSDQQYGGPTG